MAGSGFSPDVLAGRVALVTGASSGLGAHFANVLSAHGATVVLAARREAALEATANVIRERGGVAHVVSMDVRDPASVDAGVARAVELAGAPHILVNNSGVAVTKRFTEQSEDDWQFVVDTNLSGAFRVAQRVVRAMQAASVKGSIVNVGSIVGLVPGGMLTAYAASKAGLLHLTRTMAVELARGGIRVNALAPGYFSTDMNAGFFETEPGKAMLARVPMRRLGELSELDAPLLFLAADASSFVTGTVLTVDGGHSIHPL